MIGVVMLEGNCQWRSLRTRGQCDAAISVVRVTDLLVGVLGGQPVLICAECWPEYIQWDREQRPCAGCREKERRIRELEARLSRQ